jgi:hypothetical protein
MRSARGCSSAARAELTQSGRAFLDHARLAAVHVEAAVEAARRVAQPAKPTLTAGFLTEQEMDCFWSQCPSLTMSCRTSSLHILRRSAAGQA